MGSVIDGEDVVQDVLAKAIVSAPSPDAATMRPWLFRVAHNRALDVLRSRAVRRTESVDEIGDLVDDAAIDPGEAILRREAVHTAVSRFAELPVTQRSVVILKDVLDESLAEIATLLELSVDSVKAHLARGRAGLRAINARAVSASSTAPPPASAQVAQYVELFNRHDWTGLRAMLASDFRLKQSDFPLRAEDAHLFFTFYAKKPPHRVAHAWLDEREVIAVYDSSMSTPSHFMWLEWRDGQIALIRDYRYVPYVILDAELQRG